MKLGIYAEKGVPEYWIIILATREVEVYTEPQDGGYLKMERIAIERALHPRFDPTIEIPLRTLPEAS